MIVGVIKQTCPFQIFVHDNMVFSARKAYQQLLEHTHNDLFSVVSSAFDLTHQQIFQRAKDNDLTVWLSITPVKSNNFNVSAQIFCDTFSIRYCKLVLNLPLMCDGCGVPSSLDHFLIYRRGGLLFSVTLRSGMLLVTCQH